MDEIIAGLLSNDNSLRSKAEALYTAQKTSNPLALFESLLGYILSSQNPSHRSLCLVLLRRILSNSTNNNWDTDDNDEDEAENYGQIYSQLTPEARQQTKLILLRVLSTDSDKDVRKKTAMLVAQIAQFSYSLHEADEKSDDGWPNLLNALVELLTKSSREMFESRVAALQTLNYLAEFNGERIIGNNIVLIELAKITGGIMQDKQERFEVQVEALKTMCSILIAKEKLEKQFQEVVPLFLQVLIHGVSEKKASEVEEAIKTLLDLIETHPKIFNNYLNDLNTLVVNQIAGNSSVSQETRMLALELVITAVEKSAIQLRKNKSMVKNLVETGVKIIAEGVVLKDLSVEELGNEETIEYIDDEEELRKASEDVLLRLSKVVGNNVILPIAFSIIEQCMKSSEWKLRTAGLLTIGLMAHKGGKLFFEKMVHVVQMITPFISTKNSERTAFTALNVLGSLFYTFQELDEEEKIKSAMFIVGKKINIDDLEEEEEEQLMLQFKQMFSNDFLVAISNGLQPTSGFSWKIKQEMCSALLGFFTACEEKELIKPVEETILSGLFDVIRSSPKQLLSIKMEGLTAVSSLAQVLGTDFGKYYDHFMPIAKELITLCANEKATMPENCETLRGKAMDCVGLLGSAVDKSKFEPDAKFVLDMLISSSSSNNNDTINFYNNFVHESMDNDTEENEMNDKGYEVKEYIVRACARICSNMAIFNTQQERNTFDRKFKEYLKVFVPPLVEMARAKLDINIFDNELNELGQNNTSSGVAGVDINIRGMGGRRVEFNTYAVQDKELAMNMLYAYSDVYEEFFLPYTIQTMEIIHPELLSPMYTVRLAATYAAPRVFFSLVKAMYLLQNNVVGFCGSNITLRNNFSDAKNMFAAYLNGYISSNELEHLDYKLVQKVFDELVDGLVESLEYTIEEEEEMRKEDEDLFDEEDDEEEILIVTAESLAAILRISFESGGMNDMDVDLMLDENYKPSNLKPNFYISADKLKELLNKLITIMRKRIEKRLAMVRVMQQMSEEDTLQYEEILENSDKRMSEFLDSMSESIGCLIKVHSAFILENKLLIEAFQEICHPFSMELLRTPESAEVIPQLKAVGLFFYDDLIDYIGPLGDAYIADCVPYMLQLANHDNYLVRQAASYGLGVCAEKSGPVFNQFVSQTLDVLKKVILGPKAQKGSNTSATDNAVSSVYKLVLHRYDTLVQLKIDPDQLFESLLKVMPLKTDTIEAKIVHLKIMRHLLKQDHLGMKYQKQIKDILMKAAHSKKGLDKQTGEYDIDEALLTNQTRQQVQQFN